MHPRDRLSPGLRHGIDQTVAAQRLEGWRPTDRHLHTLTELLSGQRTFAEYLAEHLGLVPPPAPRRRTLRRKRPYLIPGTTTLRNNFGTESAEVLAQPSAVPAGVPQRTLGGRMRLCAKRAQRRAVPCASQVHH